MVFCFSLSDCCRDIWPRRWPRKALSRLCRLLTVWMWKASRTRSPPDRLSASWRPGIAAAEGGQARRPSLISTVMHTVCKQSHQKRGMCLGGQRRQSAGQGTPTESKKAAMLSNNSLSAPISKRTDMHEFNDIPISSPEGDLFGVDLLAQTIAKCIRYLRAPVGSVVAVHGRWGSGKSSLINLVRHHLKVAETELTILQFQCWLYRSEDALAVGFFRELHAGLSPALSNSKKAKKALRKVGARVAGSGQLLGTVAGAFGGPVARMITSSALQVIEKMIRSDDSDEALQHEVVKSLRESKRRFLVVIDDIDRLSPEEALVIFRLIKSVGRLPNVIYLLAYDRIATGKAVEARYPSEGAHYLEKIVQLGFDLPEPSKPQMTKMIESQLVGILSEEDIGDQHRFSNIFDDLVAPEIQTPRDVLRLSNAFSITFPSVRGEVEPADFLAIETLRLFRPHVYKAIRSQKSELAGPGLKLPNNNQDEIAGRYQNLFLGKEPETDQHRLKDGLQRLFPRLKMFWSNYDNTDEMEWEKARRVCSSQHFDTYFRFSLSPYTVPLTEVREILEKADEPEFVKSAFLDALTVQLAEGRTKASFLLDELTCHAGDMKIWKVTPFLQCLYSIANELRVDSDEDQGFIQTNNRDRIYRLTRALLFSRTELTERSKILFEAVHSSSLDWLVYISSSVSNEHLTPQEGEAAAPPEKCLMTKEDTETTSSVALQRIREGASDGSILEVKDLAFVLFRWRHMAGESSQEVQTFCDAALGDDQSIVRFARAFLGESYIGQVGDHVSRREDQARVKGIETFMDANRFRERLSEVLTNSELNPDDRDVVERFLNAWKTKHSGEH